MEINIDKICDILNIHEVVTFINHYHCNICKTEWEDEWDCQCDSECPSCGRDYTPYKSDEIKSDDFEKGII